MTDKVNIYELMTMFWRENDYEPFSTAEIALFFLLVGKCNSRHWKMPVKCATSVVCHAIKVSKQTAMNAREALRKRGIIRYTKGNGNANAPGYTIITDPKKWTDELTIIKTDRLTDNQTIGKTESLTVSETNNLTIYNIKDENMKDKISFNNTDGGKKLSLDELEKRLLADTSWQSSILSLLSNSITDMELKKHIENFFKHLRCQGMNEREEKDCRNHFYNWIRKQSYNTRNGINKQQDTDKRRSSDVTATSARDYNGTF